MPFKTASSLHRRSFSTNPSSIPPCAWPQLAVAAALALGVASTMAQTLPSQLPPGAEPGREPPRPVLPQPSLSAPKIDVPRSAAAAAPVGAHDVKFVLKELLIEGAAAYPAETLRPLYADLLGRKVSVAQVFDVANAIELRYRNAGYVTSRVIVPRQTVEDGRFKILVIEGFVSEVVYRADVGPARAAVERLIGGLIGLRPVNVAEIERRLLLANDLQGLSVRGALEPSATEVGGSVLVVQVERKAFESAATLDNRGSPYLGRTQLTGNAAWNGLGERADRFSVNLRSVLPADRSVSASLGYEALLTDQGGMFNLALLHSRSNPGRELEPLDVKSQVTAAVGTFSWPLIRSREQNLRAVGQLELRDVDTDIAGTAFTRDRLRIVRAGLSYDRSDSWAGITALRGTLHQGLSALGASANGSAQASRVNGRSDFTKVTLDVTRLQQLGERTSLMASLTSQFSRRPLLASEELGLGGSSFGRAFDDGEVSGDNGVAMTLELRHVPASLPHNVQLYGYVDSGRVWAADGGALVARPRLSSAGGGARASLGGTTFATFELAKPLNTEVRASSNKNVRVFASVTVKF